jgi:ribosome-binding ATPase YchF (GTP1/OBG family)
MKIGLVGYQGSGKSTLFGWLTGVAADPALAHTSQSAMALVPDARVEPIARIYHPKKITLAALELVDTPGLARSHEGNAQRLAVIREAGCLVLVVAAFERGSNPAADVVSLAEDMLLADMEIVSGRLARLRDSVKKPRPNRDAELAEIAALEPLLAALESGTALHAAGMSEEQRGVTRSFRLLTEKPRFVLVNVADDEERAERFLELLANTGRMPVPPAGGAAVSATGGGRAPDAAGGTPAPQQQHSAAAVPVRLEAELAGMSPQDREQFRQEMGLVGYDRTGLLRAIMDASGQFLYFTAGDKEVRTWMLHKGGTALEAAANIHTDLARGFIRAETMKSEDLIRLGSEREIKAHSLMRQEPKDYVVQEGDILHIRFSV